ncbi:Inositol 2-dehydrogenase/D-chiro-inositol 3-dehydrogenase [subsurface metagenome]
MRIGFRGELLDEREIRVGHIGCGSHSFRHLFPTYQFAHVQLAATCDLKVERARAYAKQFGAGSHYADYQEMIEREDLDAVVICTGYDAQGRPSYPALTVDCLRAGCHVWMEKPPAASCAEVEAMQEAERESGKFCMVGLKTMFFPANEKALELMSREDFGRLSLVTTQRPMRIPPKEELEAYILQGEPVDARVETGAT